MSIDAGASGRLDIGRVFQRTFEVLGRNFATFFILALVLVGVPAILTGLVEATQADPDGDPSFGSGFALGIFVDMVTNTILQGALIFGTVRDLNGQRASVSDSLGTGLRAFLPLIGLSILTGFGILLGTLLLIVPGIMLGCAWSVCVPVLVAENSRVFETFDRSADLTRNNRWRIFALFLIYFVVAILAAAMLGAVGGITGLLTTSLLPFNPFSVLINALVTTVLGVLGSTGVAVLYVELRQAREGAGAGWLHDVFS